MLCPQCYECNDCHEKNRANKRGNCRRKRARKCPHRNIERVAPKGEGKRIKDNDHRDEEDVKHEWPSDAMTGPAQMDVKVTQAQDAFASQYHALSTPLGIYQPPIWPQAPVFYHPLTAPSFFYQPPAVQQYQQFQMYPNMPSHSPMHTPFTWIPQPTPSAYGQYPLYPRYGVPQPFHHPLQPQQPQQYQNSQQRFYRKPKAQSKRGDPPKDPLSSKVESSRTQPEHASSLKPGNQSTLQTTSKTSTASTAIEASKLLAQREKDTDAPTPQAASELRALALNSLPPQEQPRSLEPVAHTPLEQHVQARRDAQSTARTQLEQSIEVGAENEIGQHTQVEQHSHYQQTTPNQGPGQWAQVGGAASSAAQPPSLSHNEPSAVSPQQNMQLETQPQYLAPVPQHVLLNTQTEQSPVSRPRALPPKPVPQDLVSPSSADRDRDTLGVSRFAVQHEIRAAYWAREFEFHPARHRNSAPAIQAAMAKDLAKAQEAVDRLGGFSGIGWAVWEGLEEYSNHYESIGEGMVE